MTRSNASAQSSGRGAETRRRLVQAGLVLFGRHDFDNVTTRQLAQTAEASLAAIPYHFGSKENVYLAVAAHIVESVNESIGRTLSDLYPLLENEVVDGDTLLEGLQRFISAFAHEVLGADDSAARAGFILREQLNPSAAFDMLYHGLMGQAHRTLTTLVARILEHDPDSLDMVVRAHGILGQVLGFRMAQQVLLCRLNIEAIDSDRIGEMVAAQIVHTLRLEAAANRDSS